MTDRERLADAKFKRIKEYYSAMGGLDPDIQEDMRWLINIVEELETQLSINTNNMKQLQNKIERYKRALEFYANRENYKPDHYDPNIHEYMSVIDYDEGATARQALEG